LTETIRFEQFYRNGLDKSSPYNSWHPQM
jgi:hypothetical protein